LNHLFQGSSKVDKNPDFFPELDHPSSRLFFAREQSSAGTLIGKIGAVDKDSDDKISFQIIGKICH
jgi:hypothetical protein